MNSICEPVKDLIPLCLDDTCSRDTEKFVNRHLQRCKSCSAYYRLCEKSDDVAEKRARKNRFIKVFSLKSEKDLKLIAKQVKKRAAANRIAFITGAVAAIVTTLFVFNGKNKKGR